MIEDSEDLLSVEESNYTTNGTTEFDFGEGGEHFGTIRLFLGEGQQIFVHKKNFKSYLK